MPKKVQSLKTRDGCQLVYEIMGNGPPLILIHGWTFDRTMWSLQVPDLSQHFTTISYDRRGCGDSGGEPDLRLEVDDLNDLLDHFSIDHAFLLGMSQGGRVALRYAITHPERVKAIILQAAPLDGYTPQTTQQDQLPINHYSLLVKQGEIKTVRDEWLQHPLMHIPTPNPAIKRQVRKIINRYSGQDLTDDMAERMTFPINIADNLDQITKPTLLIEGNDEIASLKDVANKMLEGIQGCKKVVINGGGHLINFIKPKKYNQIVIDFLNNL
jgi:pimeloyl-ACP methyl ester carboxylesterase